MIGNGIFNLPGTYGYGPERNFGRGSPACSPTTPALPAFAAHTTCDPGEAARLRARRIPGARKHLASGRTPVRAILVGRCASPPRSASPTTEPRTCPWRDTSNPHRATSEAPSASDVETGGTPKNQGSDPETHPAVPFRDFDRCNSPPSTNLFREAADLGGQGTGPDSRPADGRRMRRDMWSQAAARIRHSDDASGDRYRP